MCRLIKNDQGKFNFEAPDGKLLSETWYDYAEDFREGLAIVRIEDKVNVINIEGKPISDEWFDRVDPFKEGFAVVYIYWGEEDIPMVGRDWDRSICNYINREGKLLLDKWVEWATDFQNGVARIALVGSYGKTNYIRTDGTCIFEKWFDHGTDLYKGTARVYLESKINYIRTDGTYVFKEWFEVFSERNHGFIGVKLNGKYNIINNDKVELMFDEWFDSVKFKEFHYGYIYCARIDADGKHNFIDRKGNWIFKEWIDNADDGSKYLARIKGPASLCIVINGEGKYVFKIVSEYPNGWSLVEKTNGRRTLIDNEGRQHTRLYYWHNIKKIFSKFLH